MAPTTKQVMKSAVKEDKFLASMRRRHKARMKGAIGKLESKMMRLMKDIEVSKSGKVMGAKVNLKQAQAIHKQMLGLFEAEYGGEVKSLIDEFDSVAKHIKRSWKDLGESIEFTGVDRDMMRALKSQTFSEYEAFGVAAQNRVAGAMYGAVTGGLQYSDLLKTVQGALTGHKDVAGRSMLTYADQHTFDSVMNFQNEVNVKKADDLGLEHFLYVGDIIQTSRQFCITRAGKVYSKGEIEGWTHKWAGKSGPPMTHRGGYRCRHHWRGVRPEWIEGGEIDVGSYFKENEEALFIKIKPTDAPDVVGVKQAINAETALKSGYRKERLKIQAEMKKIKAGKVITAAQKVKLKELKAEFNELKAAGQVSSKKISELKGQLSGTVTETKLKPGATKISSEVAQQKDSLRLINELILSGGRPNERTFNKVTQAGVDWLKGTVHEDSLHLYRGIGLVESRLTTKQIGVVNKLNAGDELPDFLSKQNTNVASYTKKKGLAKRYSEGKVRIVVEVETSSGTILADLENLPDLVKKSKLTQDILDTDDFKYMMKDKEVFVLEPVKARIVSIEGKLSPKHVDVGKNVPKGKKLVINPTEIVKEGKTPVWKGANNADELKASMRDMHVKRAVPGDGVKNFKDIGKAANKIGEELDRVYSSFPSVEKILRKTNLSELQFDNLMEIPWKFKGVTQRVHGVYFPEQRKIRIAVKDGWFKHSKIKIGEHNFLCGYDTNYNFRHELGHHIHYSIPNKRLSEWTKIWEGRNQKEWGRLVSNYGGSNQSELFAECFAAYTSPKYSLAKRKLPDEVGAFFDELFGKKVVKKVAGKVAKPIPLKGVKVKLGSKLAQDTFQAEYSHYIGLVKREGLKGASKIQKRFRHLFKQDFEEGSTWNPKIRNSFKVWQESTTRKSPTALKHIATKIESKKLVARMKKGETGTVKNFVESIGESDYIKIRAFTQAYYDSIGVKSVKLYRGVEGKTGRRYGKLAKELAGKTTPNLAPNVSMTMKEDALSGYTSSKNIAKDFAGKGGGRGVVVTRNVPVDEILLPHDIWAKAEFGFEKEFITIGGDIRIKLKDIEIMRKWALGFTKGDSMGVAEWLK